MRASLAWTAVIAANCAAWGLVWAAGGATVDTAPIIERRPAEAALADMKGGAEQPALDLSGVTLVHAYSRPLFARDRRPWAPPPPPPPPPEPEPMMEAEMSAPPPQPPSFRLVGVSLPANSAGKALLHGDAMYEPIWVSEGEDLDGWLISKIDAQAVMLQRGDETYSLELYPGAGAPQ